MEVKIAIQGEARVHDRTEVRLALPLRAFVEYIQASPASCRPVSSLEAVLEAYPAWATVPVKDLRGGLAKEYDHGASMHKEWQALATEISRMEASELPMIAWRSVRGRVSATHYQDTDGHTYCGIKIPEDAWIGEGGPLCQHCQRRRAQARAVRRYLDTLPQRK